MGKQRLHAGPDGTLGQLHLAHVLLGEGDLGREGVGAALLQQAGGVQLPQLQKTCQHVCHAAAADAGRRDISDGVEHQRTVLYPGVVDGAGGALHSAGQAGALKGGPGGGGAAQQRSLVPQGDFAVGADVRQQGGVRALTDAAGEQGRGDIGAYKGGDALGQVDLRLRRTGQIQVPGGQGVAEELLRRKGRRCQGGGVLSGEQVEHGGVAGDDQPVDLLAVAPGSLTHPAQKSPDGLPDAPGQNGPVSCHGPAHPGDDIGAKGALGIGGSGGGQEVSAGGIELGSQGGGAQVHRRAQGGEGRLRGKGAGSAVGADLAYRPAGTGTDLRVSQHLGAAGQPDTLGQLLGGEGLPLLRRGLRQLALGQDPALAA